MGTDELTNPLLVSGPSVYLVKVMGPWVCVLGVPAWKHRKADNFASNFTLEQITLSLSSLFLLSRFSK